MPIEQGRSSSAAQFLDLEFSQYSLAEVVRKVALLASDSGFSYVVTPNVDHVVKLRDRSGGKIQSQFRAAYANATMRLCDSRILARLALLFGVRLALVPGSDLTAALFHRAIAAGDRVAIIGGKGDTVARLKALFPGPTFVQHIPPMGMLTNELAMRASEDFICQSKAGYTLFAIGAPQSEILAHRCAMRGEARGVGLCIGASIDFLLGDQKRAPLWMQQAGFEWAHRLGSSPKRLWRRYLVEGPRIFIIAGRWWFENRRPVVK